MEQQEALQGMPFIIHTCMSQYEDDRRHRCFSCGHQNAITNELFLMQAASLYLATNNTSYLTWARKEWAWFNASGMINGQWLINDGLSSSCENNGGTTWTYNQGVILGALVRLWQVLLCSKHLAADDEKAVRPCLTWRSCAYVR